MTAGARRDREAGAQGPGGVETDEGAPEGARELPSEVYRQIFELSPDGMLVSTPDGRVLAANAAACSILGMSERAIREQGRDGLVASDDRALAPALARRARLGATRARLQLRRGDGRTFPADVTSAVHEDPRGERWAWVVFRDASAEEAGEVRAQGIGELTRALLRGAEITEVLSMAARHARRLVGASVAWVTRLSDADAVEVVTGDGERAGVLVGQRFPLSNTPTARAIATGDAVLVEDPERDAGVAEAVRRLGLGPILVMPLTSAQRRFGSLVVAASRGAPTFDEHALGVVRLYADAAAVALALGEARAELERRALDVLQRVALPVRLPRVPGVRIAARYVPSTRAERVGGDWYDAFRRPDGSIALVIGDVAGRGLEQAAAVTVQVRNLTRAHLLDGAEPGRALAKVDAATTALGDGANLVMATAAVATYEAASRRLTYALAGHLPPAVAGDGGPARFLAGAAPGPPLGVARGSAPYGEATAALAEGTVVALVTDGLVERRGELLDVGMTRLLTVLDEACGASRDLERVADELMERLGRDQQDDRCLLLIGVECPEEEAAAPGHGR